MSLRSQRKLIPEVSNVASDGILGKRHPYSVTQNNKGNVSDDILTAVSLSVSDTNLDYTNSRIIAKFIHFQHRNGKQRMNETERTNKISYKLRKNRSTQT